MRKDTVDVSGNSALDISACKERCYQDASCSAWQFNAIDGCWFGEPDRCDPFDGVKTSIGGEQVVRSCPGAGPTTDYRIVFGLIAVAGFVFFCCALPILLWRGIAAENDNEQSLRSRSLRRKRCFRGDTWDADRRSRYRDDDENSSLFDGPSYQNAVLNGGSCRVQTPSQQSEADSFTALLYDPDRDTVDTRLQQVPLNAAKAGSQAPPSQVMPARAGTAASAFPVSTASSFSFRSPPVSAAPSRGASVMVAPAVRHTLSRPAALR